MTVLGIDPGSASGAWAALYDDGTVSCGDLPVVDRNVDPSEFARLVRAVGPSKAVVEQVASRPLQGVSSVFQFGRAYGCILGVLAACDVPVQLVIPGRWKKHFALDADKEKSRALAIRTWPQCASFARKKDNNRAEAALIAKWGASL